MCSHPTAGYPAARRDRRHERQFPSIGCAHYAHLIHVKPELFAGLAHLNLTRIIDEEFDPDEPAQRDGRFWFGLGCVLEGIAAAIAGA
jgi:hypothetical protein